MSMISLHILKRHKIPLNISNVGYNVKDVQQNLVSHQGQADFEVSGNGVKTHVPDLAHMTASLRPLLKKGTA